MDFACFQKELLAGVLLAGAVCTSPAVAQTYLEEYKAYNAALEVNDAEGATTHAYAAWQAAEEELGDHRLTAILAYNYGQQALFSDTENALPALRRADELRQAGLAELPDDLTLFLAYAGFVNDDGSRSKANDLRKLLESLNSNDVAPNADTVRMWLALASSDVEHGRYIYAKISARNAEMAVAAVSPDDYRTLATTLILQGVARVIPTPRRKSEVEEALALFRRAIELFPPQKSIDEFDIVLAQSVAWEYATRAAYYSDRRYSGNTFPEDPHSDESHEQMLFDPPGKTIEECGLYWDDRKPPKYSQEALRKGYIGAVLLGYHLGDDTSIHNARILAEVPKGAFSELVINSAKEWRLTTPPPDGPRCRQNKISLISFVID